MNPLRHAIALGLVVGLSSGCSSKTDQLNEELQLALGQDLRAEYSIKSIEDQVAIGSGVVKAAIVFTADGHKRALAAIPTESRLPTETGFEFSTYRKEGRGFRYFLIHMSEQEQSASILFGDQ